MNINCLFKSSIANISILLLTFLFSLSSCGGGDNMGLIFQDPFRNLSVSRNGNWIKLDYQSQKASPTIVTIF